MPYNYGFTYSGVARNREYKVSDLKSFYDSLKTNFSDKELVPILGFGADYQPYPYNGNYEYYDNQKGANSSEQGFIELARDYSSRNMVFYYHVWQPSISNTFTQQVSFLNQLSDYIGNYYSGLLNP